MIPSARTPWALRTRCGVTGKLVILAATDNSYNRLVLCVDLGIIPSCVACWALSTRCSVTGELVPAAAESSLKRLVLPDEYYLYFFPIQASKIW